MADPYQCPTCEQTHRGGCHAHKKPARGGGPCHAIVAPGATTCREDAPRRGLAHRPKTRPTWENESAPGRCVNTTRGLTRSSDLTREGLAMQATRKRGLNPAPTAPHGLTAALKAVHDAWPQRFRSKVALSAGCWEWTACKDAHGYGRYALDERGTIMAHRAALELTGTPAPLGVPVDHLCRNHSCVRPDHLEVVDAATNVRRGASANASGWCRSGRHEWAGDNILVEGNGTRRCRPCRDEREKARARRRSAQTKGAV